MILVIMNELASDIPVTTMLVVSGTVLLLAGVPLGRDLITLAVGLHVGQVEK